MVQKSNAIFIYGEHFVPSSYLDLIEQRVDVLLKQYGKPMTVENVDDSAKFYAHPKRSYASYLQQARRGSRHPPKFHPHQLNADFLMDVMNSFPPIIKVEKVFFLNPHAIIVTTQELYDPKPGPSEFVTTASRTGLDAVISTFHFSKDYCPELRRRQFCADVDSTLQKMLDLRTKERVHHV
ncbi:hypothetical protein J4228_04905 [Candidatus Woesearchaeota archaeon]|nr:hypothetical protein [Candidatus Woesearchaeota archaeon]